MEIVLNSQEFENLVKIQDYELDKDLTPTQIYDLIMSGEEPKLYNLEDGVVDLKLKGIAEDKCKWRLENGVRVRSLGYHTTGGNTISTCTLYIEEQRDVLGLAELGGHFIHEHLHVHGFKHDGENPEKNSVPYRIGDIVKMLTLNGIIIEGKVKSNLKFETGQMFNNKKREFVVYESAYHERGIKPLADLSKYRGKTIKLKVVHFDDEAVYGATIVQ